jgi:Spy/CpxP family protein refolding chaperone
MRMKRRGKALLLAVSVAALAFAAAPVLEAQETAVAPHHGPFRAILRCLRVLDLSDSQKSDIKAVLEAAKPEAEALRAKTVADRDALKAALEKDPADPCAVGTARLALKADREAAVALFEKVKDGILAVLTPVQKAKLAGCLEAPRYAVQASAETGDDE